MGHSFGGYLANLLRGKVPANKDLGWAFNCYVTLNGIFDNLLDTYSGDTPFWNLTQICPSSDPLCRPYDKTFRENFTRISPETLIGNWDQAPHFLVHGLNDFGVNWSNAQAMFNALVGYKKVKGCKYLLFKEASGEGHFVTKYENRKIMADEVSKWVQQTIQNKPPVPKEEKKEIKELKFLREITQ